MHSPEYDVRDAARQTRALLAAHLHTRRFRKGTLLWREGETSALLQALRAEPKLAESLITLLGQRLRTAFDLIQGVSTPGVRARVATALLLLLDEVSDAKGQVEIQLPVTAQEFAGAIGVAPETFSRAVKQLEEEKTLTRLGAGRYRVLDRAGLERAA